jgi:heme-degrading monooxygenase HmoA
MPQFEPPFYAVIFSSQRTARDAGYEQMAELMDRLARQQPGFLGVESVRDAAGAGITVSYWETREAIAGWKSHVTHCIAQERGRLEWYQHFALNICRVEESRSWTSSPPQEQAAGGSESPL